MTAKQYNIFFSNDIFSSLEESEKRALYPLCEVLNIKKGEEISLNERLGALISGKAKVSVKNGSGAVMKNLGIGDVFGCAMLFGGDSVTKITASCDSALICISKENMTAIFEAHPKVATEYIKYLSGKIRYLNSKIGDFAPAPAEQKLFEYLKKAEKGGKALGSMAAVARELGIGRTSLYRALDSLEQKGYISRKNNKISILGE